MNIADVIPVLVTVFNVRSGEYVFINKAVTSLLGYEPRDFIIGGNEFASSLIYPDDLPLIREIVQNAVKTSRGKSYSHAEKVSDFEYRAKHKDGRWVWLYTELCVYSWGKDGRVEYMLNASVDITRRKEAEDALKRFAENKILYEKILINNIADAIIVTDTNYIITSWNKGAEKIYGWKAEEAIGKFARDFIPTDFINSSEAKKWEKDIKKVGYWKGEVIQKIKDGRRVPILASIAIVINDQGEEIGAVAVNRDIRDYSSGSGGKNSSPPESKEDDC